MHKSKKHEGTKSFLPITEEREPFRIKSTKNRALQAKRRPKTPSEREKRQNPSSEIIERAQLRKKIKFNPKVRTTGWILLFARWLVPKMVLNGINSPHQI